MGKGKGEGKWKWKGRGRGNGKGKSEGKNRRILKIHPAKTIVVTNPMLCVKVNMFFGWVVLSDVVRGY